MIDDSSDRPTRISLFTPRHLLLSSHSRGRCECVIGIYTESRCGAYIYTQASAWRCRAQHSELRVNIDYIFPKRCAGARRTFRESFFDVLNAKFGRGWCSPLTMVIEWYESKVKSIADQIPHRACSPLFNFRILRETGHDINVIRS